MVFLCCCEVVIGLELSIGMVEFKNFVIVERCE